MKNILRPFSNAPIIVETDTTIASKPLHIAAINKPSPTQPLRVPQSDPAQKVAMQGDRKSTRLNSSHNGQRT